ncbi:hypothetical protein [Algicola sagamiensis]|uniref:hypothetical protein n=1 Tax=Algicola sagamiensis TaxID=163869 RepID=UPI00036A6122|nr:hypothetical protein [Algicola sagamiensis]
MKSSLAQILSLLFILTSIGAMQAKATESLFVELVHIYSNGKRVKTYKAIRPGNIKEACYEFPIVEFQKETKITVCSDYIVEIVR